MKTLKEQLEGVQKIEDVELKKELTRTLNAMIDKFGENAYITSMNMPEVKFYHGLRDLLFTREQDIEKYKEDLKSKENEEPKKVKEKSFHLEDEIMKKLEDTDLMPFGKWKGTAMTDIPASYLLWLYDNDMQDGNVKDYIEDNLEILRKEK